MVRRWPGRSRSLDGLAGLDRLDGFGAEGAADLARKGFAARRMPLPSIYCRSVGGLFKLMIY